MNSFTSSELQQFSYFFLFLLQFLHNQRIGNQNKYQSKQNTNPKASIVREKENQSNEKKKKKKVIKKYPLPG